MKTYENDHGLLVDNSTTPPTCAGYVFNFAGHGAFAPDGRLGDLTQKQIDEHNALLAQAEWKAILKHGAGTLYLVTEKCPDGFERSFVKTWTGHHKAQVSNRNTSRNNFGAARTDVWFHLDGSNWHGVNVGDNQICRVKRCKN